MTSPSIYSKHFTIDQGQHVLYVSLKKMIYECLRSTLLSYKTLVKDLESQVLVINPYDPCVVNRIINVKKITITWHVDDLKISYVDKNDVTIMIKWIRSIYDKYMRVWQGKKHDSGWISVSNYLEKCG